MRGALERDHVRRQEPAGDAVVLSAAPRMRRCPGRRAQARLTEDAPAGGSSTDLEQPRPLAVSWRLERQVECYPRIGGAISSTGSESANGL